MVPGQKEELMDTVMRQLKGLSVAFILGVFVFEFCLAWYGLTHL